MKTPVLALSVLFGVNIFNPNIVEAVDLPGGGAAFIRCNKIGTGTYVAPWSFESYNNSPIIAVSTRARATSSSPKAQTYVFTLRNPTFDYENQFVFSSPFPIPVVSIRGTVLTPFGPITTFTPEGIIPVIAFCPPPLP